MRISLNYISKSYKGLNRDENKDCVEIIEKDDYALFIVFDGISSSEKAIEAINISKNFIIENEHLFKDENNFKLKELMYETNKFLLLSNIEKGFTTYALVYIDKNHNSCKISNLGDTRIYSVNKQSIPQLTVDDRFMNESNVVTKYLGMLQYNHEDFKENQHDIKDGTRLLVCSDGFFEFIEKLPIKMHKVLNFKKLGSIKNSLDKIISKQNQDDASYILIKINYV